MIDFIKRYCYIIFPVITIIVSIIIYWSFDYMKQLEYDVSTIIQMAGTLIGFLLTAITIFASIPKNTEYMKRFEKHQHKKIFSKCISLGIITLTICILTWIINVPSQYIVLIFIIGLEETLFSAYYLYRLCFDNQ